MKHIKKILILLLSMTFILLCFTFYEPLETEAYSDDENAISYVKLHHTSDYPITIYSETYQSQINTQINKIINHHQYTFD